MHGIEVDQREVSEGDQSLESKAKSDGTGRQASCATKDVEGRDMTTGGFVDDTNARCSGEGVGGAVHAREKLSHDHVEIETRCGAVHAPHASRHKPDL